MVLLSKGTIIPADGLLIEAQNISMDEAFFQGTPYDVEKNIPSW